MAIPPVTLNLLQLLPGDDQQTHTDKINFNFDAVISLGGGPPGLTGSIGSQGVPGSQGLQGFMGSPGTPGSQWFVQSTVPLISPSPNVNDYWFNTATLDVFQWDGSTWVSVGTLSVAGVLKDSIGDTDRVVFSTPTPSKSLVLSPLDYGVGAPQPGAYKLKLIGASGTNVMNFGVVESGSVENVAAKQSYITVSTIIPATTYGLGIINPSGPIEVNAPGTTLKIVEQAGGVSVFEFNGMSTKFQINPTDRNLGFSPSVGSGLGFHIGLQDALTDADSRGLSVFDLADGFKISLRGAHSDPVTADVANFPAGIFFDSKNKLIDSTAAVSAQLWSRFRSKISAANSMFLNVKAERTFDDPGNGTNPWRSSAVSLGMGIDDDTWHNIMFTGGAKAGTQDSRPQIRLSSFWSSGFHTAVDINGRWGFGNNAFIEDNNSTTDVTDQYSTNINIQGPASGTMQGLDIFGGIHFTPEDHAGVTNRRMGITAGTTNPTTGKAISTTHAGMLFKRTGTGGSLDIEFSTGIPGALTAPGARTRQSILGSGEVRFHGLNNATAGRNMLLEFTVDPGATVGTNDGIAFIGAFDSAAHGGLGMQKDIILLPDTDAFTDSTSANYHGGGFLGIGDMTSNLHQKPQTKLQVKGATTFGTRSAISNYTTNVGLNDNWTFGDLHRNAADRGMIISGSGHQLTSAANDSVIIGYSGTSRTVSTPNVVAIPTRTSVGFDTLFWDSNTAEYALDNNISISADGQGTATNGIEVQYNYDSLLPNTFDQAAAILVSLKDRYVPLSSIQFVVRGDGHMGVRSNVIEGTDPLMIGGATWTDSGLSAPATISAGTNASIIMLGVNNPITSPPTYASASQFTTLSRNNSNSGTIRGRSLMINPGITRNTSTNPSANAIGSSVYIRGGRGEKNSGGTPLTTTYGNVYIGYDFENAVSSGKVAVGHNATIDSTDILDVDGGQVRARGGYRYAMTIAINVPASTGVTYNHNLGYVPMPTVVCNDGNVHPNITLLTDTQIRIYNNPGTSTAVGTIYLW